jgi:flagellar hook-basal body complex protein FliE
VNLHQVMLHLEESRIGLQLLLQVRNRVLEAYQDVMKMQV